MDRKKREFHSLTQGNKTVEAYQREFLDLSHYAEEDIATDARRQEKFREGLQADIKLALLVHDFDDFTVSRAHLRARPRRSVRSGYRTTCTVQMHQLQGSLMSHRVCLLHRLGSQCFLLHHPELLFPLPIMVYAS